MSSDVGQSDRPQRCIPEVEPNDREAVAAWRFFFSPYAADVLHASGIVAHVGQMIHPWWALFRIPYPNTGGTITGDIDVVAGRMIANASTIDLPEIQSYRDGVKDPHVYAMTKNFLDIDLSYLAAFEVKCAYVEAERDDSQSLRGKIRADHASPRKHAKLHDQLEGLQRLGFDCVSLIDVTGGVPSKASNAGFSFGESAVSYSAVDNQHRRLRSPWRPPNGVGHFASTIGGILGLSEIEAGYATMETRQIPQRNHLLQNEDVAANRVRLVDYLKSVLGSV